MRKVTTFGVGAAVLLLATGLGGCRLIRGVAGVATSGSSHTYRHRTPSHSSFEQRAPSGPSLHAEQGMTSEFHKKNVGRFVFSVAPIVIGKEDPAQIKTSFTLNDPMYSRCYMAHSMTNECTVEGEVCYSARLVVHFLVNGREVAVWNEAPKTNEILKEHTTYEFPSLTERLKLKYGMNTFFYERVVPALKVGSNKIDVVANVKRIYADKPFISKPVCKNTITLNVAPGDIKAFLARNLPELPRAGMHDPALEKAIFRLLPGRTFKGDTPINKIIIASPGWNYVRNRLTGIIVNRYITAWVPMKLPDGSCMLYKVYFREENQGGNRYGRVFMAGTSGVGPYRVPCAVFK